MKKEKHLEMIQNIILRMASNSFLLKSWSVIIISALFALSAKESNSNLIIVAYLPAISFWFLDSFFLWQERMYRKLYDAVRERDELTIDYSLDAYSYKKSVSSWFLTCFSKTLVIFHGTILTTIIIVTIILKVYCK